MTIPEQKLWSILRGRRLAGLKFRRQHPIGPYVVDFSCESVRLVVEVDGESHATCGEYDLRRQKLIETEGWSVFRVSNDDVLTDLENVALGIARAAGINIEDWLETFVRPSSEWSEPAVVRSGNAQEKDASAGK